MKRILLKLAKMREISAILFLIALFLIIGIINPIFLQGQNIMLTLKGSIMYVFLAAGMTFVILTKEIDVSVGAILGISAAVAATMLRNGNNIVLILLVTLLVGAAAGFINGFGVAKLGVPSIVMTLGTMGILRGLMFIYTGGKWVENLPDYFKKASQVEFLGINVFILITLTLIIMIQLYLSRARKGRFFAAIGDNIEGARLVGVPVNRMKITAFILAGIFSALAGLVYVSQVGFVGNVAGSGAEMTAIAACVLGGVSLQGGIGSVVGAAFGAIIMSSINTGLVFLKVPAYWNNTISGTLLILIVVVDALVQRHLSEKAKKQRLMARTSFVKEDVTIEA